jgi:hypothetical protein
MGKTFLPKSMPLLLKLKTKMPRLKVRTEKGKMVKERKRRMMLRLSQMQTGRKSP